MYTLMIAYITLAVCLALTLGFIFAMFYRTQKVKADTKQLIERSRIYNNSIKRGE